MSIPSDVGVEHFLSDVNTRNLRPSVWWTFQAKSKVQNANSMKNFELLSISEYSHITTAPRILISATLTTDFLSSRAVCTAPNARVATHCCCTGSYNTMSERENEHISVGEDWSRRTADLRSCVGQ